LPERLFTRTSLAVEVADAGFVSLTLGVGGLLATYFPVPNAGLAAEEWTGVQGLVRGIRVTKSPLSNIRRYRSRPFVKVTRAKGKKSSFVSGTSFRHPDLPLN